MFLFGPLFAIAEINVSGVVLDIEQDEPLVGASILVKGSDGKIKKFTTTTNNGTFTMQIPSMQGGMLEVLMMGFTKQVFPLDGLSFPLTIRMKVEAIQLKEVAVKADRIREQGDTVTYYVGSFAQMQDRSIGDVLKRMPGIDVAKNGKIQYQGEDINKFYIEGSDLLGGKYGIATNGINHEDIGAIEVLENHQPMQVLSGINFSNKAAINLKLKDKAKATWNTHGEVGGGFSWQPENVVWDGELFAMAAMPSFQSMATLRTNNIGEDLSATNSDFFANSKETNLNPFVNINLPSVSSLKSSRTFLNRSVLASSDNLWKLKNGEFKFNIDYSFNRVASNASSMTTFFLNEGNKVITEHLNGVEHEHSLNGKFIYELNQRSAFINNTLQTNIEWNDISLNTTGSTPNIQSVTLTDYYIGNNFKMIKRFKGNHLVTFESRNEWELLPHTLNLDVNGNTYLQKFDDKAFFTHESASYAFTLKDVTVSLEGGIKGYWRSMNSNLSKLPEEISGITENVVNTNSFTTYVNPKFEYWMRKVDITLQLPISYAHYTFDNTIANRDEVYFSPSLGFNWKPNNRFSGSIRGGLGRSPMNLNKIYPGLIMTNYRTLESGLGDFYSSSSQNVSASFNYKHTRHGLFANGLIMHSWTQLPYTMSQQLYDDYVIYSYADADNDSKILLAMATLGKTLNFMHGSFNLNGTFNRNSSTLLSQEQSVQSVSTGWSIGGKINGSPCQWFSFDYAIEYYNNCLTMNDADSPWLSTLTNELSINFVPHKMWQWQVSGEHYHNELAKNTYKTMFMIDTKLIFKPIKNIELSLSLSNILNERQYNYIVYSQLSSFESQRSIRGRQVLFSIAFR